MADTHTAPETGVEIVKLTEAAQRMARKFLAAEAEPEGKALRVGVDSGGCSGFSYAVKIDDRKPGDHVQRYEGFDAVVDEVSKSFIEGSVLDYVDTLGEAGFKFVNPNAQSTCGCGTSFTV